MTTNENDIRGQSTVNSEALNLGLVNEQSPEVGARKEAVPAGLEPIILAAARGVWFAQQVGTLLPFLVVEGFIWIENSPSEFVVKERTSVDMEMNGGGVAMDLVVKEAGYGAPGSCELCGPDEVACFVGGAPKWRETIRRRRNKFPDQLEGWGDWEILKDMLGDEAAYDCADIAATIRANLLRNGWIKKIETSLPPDGETLLRDLVNRRDVVPGAMLLHAVLHALARSPIQNATKILDLCDLVGSSPDNVKYKDATFRGLQALSKAINKRRFSRASMEVHRLLRSRGIRQCFPGFIHEAKPRATAEFI